jgi:hypothetical protein
VISHVGGCFIYKSRTKLSANNKKTKKENTFARSKNLTTKTELFSSSFVRQIYRFEQLAIPQVGGWFTYKSAICTKKTEISIFSNAVLKQIYRFGQLAKLQVGGWFIKNTVLYHK